MDYHVVILLDDPSPDQRRCLAAAVRALRARDPDFPDLVERHWWHKAPDDARATVARTLSRHGCTGRLSVEPRPEAWSRVETAPPDLTWQTPPPRRWTGFSTRQGGAPR